MMEDWEDNGGHGLLLRLLVNVSPFTCKAPTQMEHIRMKPSVKPGEAGESAMSNPRHNRLNRLAVREYMAAICRE